MSQSLFIKYLFLSLTIILFMIGILYASDESIFHISAPELKYMMSQKKVVVINSMSEIEFDRQHIPNSINIPLINMSSSKKLPQDINIPLAFYCMGKR